MVFCFDSCCILSVGITSTLVRRPLSTAIIRGSDVTLQCSSNVNSSFIQWFNSLCVTTTEHVSECADDFIYSGYSLHPDAPQQKFSVTEVNNATHVTRDLNIRGTELTDAGVYLCAKRVTGVASVTDSSSAQLIVLGNCSLVSTCKVRNVGLVDNDIMTINRR